MTADHAASSFRLAKMSPLILGLTLVLLALPVILSVPVLLWSPLYSPPALFIGIIYAWVWLRFRPTRFVIRPGFVEVIWPLKRRYLRRAAISAVRLIDRQELRRTIGWGMRIGAGGLWGGFGWLWTQRCGIVQMYISRTDAFVWIECVSGRPWLITPERPEDFVRALA